MSAIILALVLSSYFIHFDMQKSWIWAFTCVMLVGLGCYRQPGSGDYKIKPVQATALPAGLRCDGFYYLVRKEDREYSHYALRFAPDGTCMLIPFGSESSSIHEEAWSRIYHKMRKVTDPNRKGHYIHEDGGAIKVEICHGYPSRGYYFVQYQVAIKSDFLTIRYAGFRKYRRVMKDFPPDFGSIGLGKTDTLSFVPSSSE